MHRARFEIPRRAAAETCFMVLALASLAAGCASRAEVPRAPESPAAPVAAEPPPALAFAIDGPRRDALDLAVRAYRCGLARGEFASPILTVIDYSRPSVERRLWVLDVESGVVLFHELVAHGRGSGENLARSFSNDPGSKMSSLGLYRTAQTYEGAHGLTLRLIGLEPGVNDRAEERQIVIHGAAYVSDEHAKKWGRLGRSWGCPALDLSVAERVIERIQGGTALFVYYPDSDWLGTSKFLHCAAAR